MAKKTQSDMIKETHDTVIKLNTVLLGTNGDNGLCGDVKRVFKMLELQEKEHNKLKLVVYSFIGLIMGSGVITGGVFGILQAIN